MKVLAQRIYADPKYAKTFHWFKLITITGSAQVLVQALGLVSGIIIIRLLSIEEYALYTLANTMLGTMTLLSDGGISTGVMSEGGKVWNNKEKLGSVMITGLKLRKKFAIGSLIISTPILVVLLLRNGASLLTTILIILSLIPAFLAALSDTLLEIVPKLHQDISALQKNQVAANIGRAILICLSLFVFPFAFIAIGSASIARIWANIRLRKISGIYADFSQKYNIEVQSEIIKIVKRILPAAIYYCLSGQITIWLISIFGSTQSVAQVGALSRLSALLTFFSILISILVTPRFARLPSNRKVLLVLYTKVHVGLLLFCTIIVLFSWALPSEILWILGNTYKNLTIEFLLSVIGSCFGLIAGISLSLYMARGWAMNPAISISISGFSIIIASIVIDISSLRGILYLNIFVSFIQLIMHGLYGLIMIMKLNENVKRKNILYR